MEKHQDNYSVVGLLDKNKKLHENLYMKAFEDIVIPAEYNIVVKKHGNRKNQFVIHIQCTIEEWLLEAANENNIQREHFSIPSDFNKYEKLIKRNSNENVIEFVTAIYRSESKHFKFLERCIRETMGLIAAS